MSRNEQTSKRVAKLAGKQLRSPKTPKPQKGVAGSALTQAADKRKAKRKTK